MPAKPAPLRVLGSYGLTITSGVLYFLGFAGFDIWPLCFVALVPLFFALDGVPLGGAGPLSQRRAVALGLLFGFVTNMGGYYWLVVMLESFSGFPTVLCIFFAAALCFYQGGLLALFSWLFVRARARGFLPTVAAVPAFAAAELIYPLLFDSYFGASLHGLPMALQLLDVGGPILLTALVVLVNSAVYEVLRALLRRERVPLLAPALALASAATMLAYGAFRIGEVDARSARAPGITVGVVQTNMGIFDKRDDPREGHRRHLEQSRALEEQAQPPDLLVWPESAYTSFLPQHVTNVKRWVTGPLHTPVLFGGLALREVDGTERHYNTAFVTDGDGNIRGTYDKTYLLAFGEYLPLGEVFPTLYDISKNSGHFSRGTHVRPLPFGSFRVATLICYEDILPGFVRQAVREGNPHLLVNITNDAWFGDTTEPWIHLALAKLRAVEHHRWLVRSTNSGVSAIIDPVGRVVARTGAFTREQLYGEVKMMTGRTLYAIVGDWPGWLGLCVAAWAAFVGVGRRR